MIPSLWKRGRAVASLNLSSDSFEEEKRLLDWVGLLFRLVGSPAGLQIEPSSLLTEDDSSFPCLPSSSREGEAEG